MSVRPRTRVARSVRPPDVEGAQTIDRYLLALEGLIELEAPDFAELERSFVEEAKIFGRRRGISYDAWRDVGVSAQVLTRAGLAETVKQ